MLTNMLIIKNILLGNEGQLIDVLARRGASNVSEYGRAGFGVVGWARHGTVLNLATNPSSIATLDTDVKAVLLSLGFGLLLVIIQVIQPVLTKHS
jgi:hypothetical protein